MTIIDQPTAIASRAVPTNLSLSPAVYETVVVDLYRDIHKGIRAELFALTTSAGSLDPADAAGRSALAAHVRGAVDLLEQHAHHEDDAIGATLADVSPALHERIELEHASFDAQTRALVDLAELAANAGPVDQGRLVSRLYGDLASFTGVYLLHQEVEERVVMPALQASLGVESCLAIHQAIVGSIPPDQMARSLAVMIPAMNIDDRTELLGGMKAGAPPEVFAGVWSLVGSLLDPADTDALGRRLGVNS